jgi:hypothetical protein
MASRLKEKKISRFDIKAPSKIMVEILFKNVHTDTFTNNRSLVFEK